MLASVVDHSGCRVILLLLNFSCVLLYVHCVSGMILPGNGILRNRHGSHDCCTFDAIESFNWKGEQVQWLQGRHILSYIKDSYYSLLCFGAFDT